MAPRRRVHCGEEVKAMRLFGLFFAVGLASSLLFNPPSAEGQGSKSQQPSKLSVATPLLRGIAVRPHGFDDATLNGTVLDEQKEYVNKHLKSGPTLETVYDQKKADEMKKALEDFWKERGVTVEVRAALKRPLLASRFAILEFDVYKQ